MTDSLRVRVLLAEIQAMGVSLDELVKGVLKRPAFRDCSVHWVTGSRAGAC